MAEPGEGFNLAALAARYAPQTTVADAAVDFTRLLYMLFMELEGEIGRADQKAQIVLTADAILAAALAGFGFGRTGGMDLAGGALVSFIFQVATLIALLVSVTFALNVALPRFGSKRGEGDAPNAATSLFFSGYITSLDPQQYVDQFMGASLQEIKQMVMLDIESKAKVAQYKFLAVRRSMIWTGVAILLWAVGEVVGGIL